MLYFNILVLRGFVTCYERGQNKVILYPFVVLALLIFDFYAKFYYDLVTFQKST